MNNTPRYPQRVRNDLRFRELTVLRVERISAGFQKSLAFIMSNKHYHLGNLFRYMLLPSRRR